MLFRSFQQEDSQDLCFRNFKTSNRSTSRSQGPISSSLIFLRKREDPGDEVGIR